MTRQGSENDLWIAGKGTFDGQSIVFRVLDSRPPDWRSMPVRFGVALPLEAELPDRATAAKLAHVEDVLIEAFRAVPATLTLALTLPFAKEFIFYTTEGTRCREQLGHVRTLLPATVMQSYFKSDPRWEVYAFFRQGIDEQRSSAQKIES